MTDWHRLRFDRKGPFTDPASGKRIGTYARPFITTPSATGDLLAVLISDAPTSTITELRAAVVYDTELQEILDRYIADGWGHIIGREVFHHY